jgi:membrane-associated HD superfamily phosphohydrolase
VGYPVKPNDKIGQVVDRIINERVVEGQLDDCELTLRDLREIRAAFTAVLSNIYHPRVDYPTMPRATPAPAAATRRP